MVCSLIFRIILIIFILPNMRGYKILLPTKKLTNLNEQVLRKKLSCETSLKQKFRKISRIQFWLHLKSEYNILSNKALKVLLPFATSYSCETGISALATIKSKYHARLVVEKSNIINHTEIS